jgi:type II secretory pathway component PulM
MMKANTPSIEAYGVRGMNSTPWRKIFKTTKALNAWIEKHNAEVHGIRDIQPSDTTFR